MEKLNILKRNLQMKTPGDSSRSFRLIKTGRSGGLIGKGDTA